VTYLLQTNAEAWLRKDFQFSHNRTRTDGENIVSQKSVQIVNIILIRCSQEKYEIQLK